MNRASDSPNPRSFSRVLGVLSKADRRKLSFISVGHSSIGILDLIGVGLIGLVGAVSVAGLNSQKLEGGVSTFLKFLKLDGFDFRTQVALLGVLAVLFFTIRTFFSIILTRKILHILSKIGAEISSSLFSKLLSNSLLQVKKRTTQETIYSLTTGVESLVLQVIGSSFIMLADIALLALMLGALFLIDPITTLISVMIFGAAAILLFRIMNSQAKELGSESSILSVASSEKISEAIATYRESMVRGSRGNFAEAVREIRIKFADARAELNFQPYVSKYVIESTVIIGGLLISALQLFMGDVTEAVSTLAIFLTAGTRIAPAVLRVQQGLVQVKAGLGQAEPSLKLLEELDSDEKVNKSREFIETEHPGFVPIIEMKNVSFRYPGEYRNAIEKIDLEITPGTNVAIVGPSGAGKTTLIDLMLGVIPLSEGQILISGMFPSAAIETWPGAIAYVPQDVAIIKGSIEENIGLGYSEEILQKQSSMIEDAVQMAQLSDLISSTRAGYGLQVGEQGSKISGGQKQRIGIARAILTKPKLLVLDEATSSLDAETEASLTSAILRFRGEATIIQIAHRLSTVKNADLVVYLEDGRILASGSFEEVRSKVPNFDSHAQLMGL